MEKLEFQELNYFGVRLNRSSWGRVGEIGRDYIEGHVGPVIHGHPLFRAIRAGPWRQGGAVT